MLSVNAIDFVQSRPWLRGALALPRAVGRQLISFPPILTTSGSDVIARINDLVKADIRIAATDYEGEFMIGPRSHILAAILDTGHFEEAVARLASSLVDPDRDVIDVGANIGLYTVLTARRLNAGRVLAAEPTGAAFARLQANLAINGVTERVILFKGLLGKSQGDGSINVIPGREEYSSVGTLVHPSIAGEVSNIERVPATTIDQLVEQHDLSPALIKIDVEGGEEAVLDGARETLARHRPVILSEFAAVLLAQCGSTPRGLLEKFDKWGYDVRDAFGRDIAVDGVECSEIIATPRQL